MTEIYFYTRPNCSLCEEAKLNLQLVREDIPFTLHEVNIDDSDKLTEEYGLMIPVITHNNHLIQYGQCDYATIRTYLEKHS
ncbi:glutaredoxin [Bacillus ectoiniformans]|uniref:glutaredoxin family protein n=1 Tax=Bacillus ectoiniformans TaxID=1494429 RepID=UPI00195B5A44|nr:glutaredoxin family protein [Bacillus ectoiniformans]MBM7648741.1 glutaredoxin [Bacillus ectoiniformans]